MTTTIRLPLLALLGLGLLTPAPAAQGVNLGFDESPPAPGAPAGWDSSDPLPASGGLGYELATVGDAHDGPASARLRFVGPGRDEGPDFATFTQAVDAAPWRGRRVRLRGWLRSEEVESGAGLWMRIDGEGGLLAFDNMSDRFVLGDTDWTRYDVVHDVAPAAEQLVFGVLLTGRGTVWMDSLQLDVVDSDVETTTLVAPEPFEDEPADPYVIDWIRRHALVLDGIEPYDNPTELLPFVRSLDARVVALGQASHGTHEQHRLRQRLVEAFVAEPGSDIVVLDIDWSTGLYIDQWVRRGRGDPRAELAALPDWTWRHEEVLDLLVWLRSWNTGATSDERVRVAGMNGRDVRASLPLAVSYLERVSADDAESFDAAVRPVAEAEAAQHRATDDQLQRASYVVEHVLERFDAEQAAWSAETSPRAWRRARHLVEVTGQALQLQGARAEAPWVDARSRAENVIWLSDSLGDDPGRVLVLAHNESVVLEGQLEFPTLGQELRQRLGDDYAAVGAAFGRGVFRARNGRTLELQTYELGAPSPGSVGETLGRAHDGPLLLDLRAAPPAGPVARWLERPHRLRCIGPWYSEHAADLFAPPRRLGDHVHAVMFVPETTLAMPLGEP